MKRIHLVQLAGGKGLRVGGETPKQFRATGSGMLFSISLREFLKLPAELGQVVSITVTAAEKWDNVVKSILHPLSADGINILRAEPGSSRTESTWNALQLLHKEVGPGPDDLVAVHDAARPFATVDLFSRLVTDASNSGAAVPGIPVADTILQKSADTSEAVYLDRPALVAVQTPQVFTWELLHEAHLWADTQGKSFTDDGCLVALRGTNPVVTAGEQTNWKVTTERDWVRAAELLS